MAVSATEPPSPSLLPLLLFLKASSFLHNIQSSPRQYKVPLRRIPSSFSSFPLCPHHPHSHHHRIQHHPQHTLTFIMANPPTTAAAEHLIDSQQEPQLLYQPPPPASYNLSFPPFPHLQNNTPLIPFADFVPKGTQIKVDENEDEEETQDRTSAVERDGEGVPTVMLGVTHDLGKSNKKSAKGRSRGSKTRADGTPKPWFEQWADNEDLMRAEPLNLYVRSSHSL